MRVILVIPHWYLLVKFDCICWIFKTSLPSPHPPGSFYYPVYSFGWSQCKVKKVHVHMCWSVLCVSRDIQTTPIVKHLICCSCSQSVFILATITWHSTLCAYEEVPVQQVHTLTAVVVYPVIPWETILTLSKRVLCEPWMNLVIFQFAHISELFKKMSKSMYMSANDCA